MAERDELDFLRRAWSEVTPPAPHASIDRPDAETRRVLDFMRAAWGALQPPPARVPWRLRVARVHHSKAFWAAAAALVLALFGASLLMRESARPIQLTHVESPAHEPASGAGHPLIASIAHDRTEIRSGPVRLILFSQNPSEVPTSKEAR